MEKIPSFKINHLVLEPGIYVSRQDSTPHGDILTTFDIRLTRPNREPAVKPEALHTIEHLAATWLRNNPYWSDKVIYWGPMGCCTGNYLILSGEYKPQGIIDLMKEMFSWISQFNGNIPGATARDCGNYTFNDLNEAKIVAKKFLDEVLLNIDNRHMEYPD